jgi:hypothetical protein
VVTDMHIYTRDYVTGGTWRRYQLGLHARRWNCVEAIRGGRIDVYREGVRILSWGYSQTGIIMVPRDRLTDMLMELFRMAWHDLTELRKPTPIEKAIMSNLVEEIQAEEDAAFLEEMRKAAAGGSNGEAKEEEEQQEASH